MQIKFVRIVLTLFRTYRFFKKYFSKKEYIMKGKVKWYNIKQGYGFVNGEDGRDVFIHKSDIPFWTIYLKKGDKIEYTKEKTYKGVKAKNLKII
jgi:CspA family cold shock protein